MSNPLLVIISLYSALSLLYLFDRCSCMCYINILNCRNFTKTCDLTVYTVKVTGSNKLTLPGIIIITGHIVVGMITCNNHQRTQNDFLVTCILHCFNDCFTCCVFRFTFNGTDKDIFITKFLHLSLPPSRLLRGRLRRRPRIRLLLLISPRTARQ